MDDASQSEQPKKLKRCYSVGSYGPFPISFYSLNGHVYYHPQEYDECGPFDSLESALAHAEKTIGIEDGGFHKTLKKAEKHAEWMREKGFGFG